MNERVKPPEAVVEALQRIGFPFQTAVARAIEAAAAARWRVHASEYSWRSAAGDTRFLDLVATNGVIYLTIEGKKTSKEILTFLRPLGAQESTGLVPTFRCLRAFIPADQIRQKVLCETWDLYPRSNRSEFCVVSTSPTGDQRLLERDAGLLIQATDAFAHGLVNRGEATICAREILLSEELNAGDSHMATVARQPQKVFA